MSANAEVLAFLDQLNTYTNTMAAAQATQAEKLDEIAADIDSLLSSAGAATLDEATKARLEEASASIASIAAFETAQAETLTAIAAKNDEPLPDPVDPEPPPA